jgi:hypothetical protein
MIRTLLIISALAQALSAQTVTFLQGDWEKSGIIVVPYDPSPGFAVAARSSAPGVLSQSAVDISSVLPYSFILRNTSARTIVAYSARWATSDANGQVRTHDMTWENVQTLSGVSVIVPASDRLVMPVQQLAPPGSPSSMAKFSAAIDNVRKLFTNQAKIAVSLEAVIADNGVALGSDSGNTIQRISSRIDAQREVFSGIIAAGQNGQSAVITYLQNLADGPRGSLIAASRQPTPDLAYADFFSVQRGDMARTYLGLARQNFGGLMSLAEERMRQPRFVIHR